MESDKVRKAERILELAQLDAVSDISVTGLCLKSAQPLKDNALHSLELSNKEMSVTVRARVVHVRKASDGLCYNGIEFAALSNEQKDQLSEMVESYSRGVPIQARLLQ